jgi:tetratricopeptide (TPR) repeat protein
MKCPQCGYDNRDDALLCNMCQAVFRKERKAAPPPRRPPLAKGDVLGQKYEIHGVLGEGGFGIVYLAYHRPSNTVMALKTFRDEFLEDDETRALFRKEAQILADLDPHPHLVRAFLVDEVHGRLFIALEFIAPDQDGLNTLEGHLKRRPPDLARCLRWAIQFCHGMEFAEARGLRCHRDIKPANIMIDAGGRLLISDFGLAGAVQLSKLTRKPLRTPGGEDGRTAAGAGFGTPTHMPPEQFAGAARCDERSDIYAFGVVLFQMAARGRVPFWCDDRAQFWQGMYRLHASAPVPPLDSPLFPIIERCLQKNPIARYQRFGELRQQLEVLLRKTTGEAPPAPDVKRRENADWNAKGLSLQALGRHDDALACFDRSLALAQSHQAWNNKGVAYMRLRRWAEAVDCFDRAIALENDDHPWINKSGALLRMGRKQDALSAAEAALERNPASHGGWANTGAALLALGRHEEALTALDRALAIDAGAEETWATKVAVLQQLGRVEQALAAADECLSIHPAFAIGWANKGYCLSGLGRHEEALACFERALSLDGTLVNAWAGKRSAAKALGRTAEVMAALDRELELEPEHGPTWLDKGRELVEAKRWQEALACMESATRFEPEWPLAWTNLGLCLLSLNRLEDAEAAYRKALALNPEFTAAALTRGDILRRLSRWEEAVACFDAAIAAGRDRSSAARMGAAWFYRGDCLHRLGRRDEAQRSYAKAFELLPENARGQVAAAAEACRLGLPPPQ